LVECGRALPVARRNSDRSHCVVDLTSGVENLHWHTEAEANEFVVQQRWTQFRSPLNMPTKCLGSHPSLAVQPMVVYTNQTLLDNADRQFLPESWDAEYLIWKKLNNFPDEYQATCGTSNTIASLMNHWADGLLGRFDAMVRLGRDHEYLLRIADFALCAATDRNKRWEAYLRYSIAQQPDKVQRTFETMIKREFGGVTWDAFIDGRSALTDVLRSGFHTDTVPNAAVATSTVSSLATALPKVRGIAAERPIPSKHLIKQ
jgi:hypothetical protein